MFFWSIFASSVLNDLGPSYIGQSFGNVSKGDRASSRKFAKIIPLRRWQSPLLHILFIGQSESSIYFDDVISSWKYDQRRFGIRLQSHLWHSRFDHVYTSHVLFFLSSDCSNHPSPYSPYRFRIFYYLKIIFQSVKLMSEHPNPIKAIFHYRR